ncbi:hypothetical protein C2S51_036140 [Perilla frutescens var. frutescens]|nr:hypothetical protein C2S51_036140 [Perilla frutescens var. frutescens]
MGRRKKLVEQITTANEDKDSNIPSSETKSGVEKLHSLAVYSNALEAINVENHAVIRRSNRIKSLRSPTCSLGVEPVVEHLTLVEEVKDQELEVEQVNNPPEVDGRSLEEKVDYLITVADDFESKVFGRDEEIPGPGPGPNPNPNPGPDINYKSLYFDSQKKIEALMEDNYDLVRKLEFARGKIAAYGEMKDALAASKEVLLVSALGKAADITTSLSPQAAQKSTPTPPVSSPHGADDPKPKKTYKKRVRWAT